MKDGSSLYALCTESEIWQEAACIAFAIAVALNVMLSSETPLFGHEACIPAKVSREQIKDTVVALLKDEPQLRQDYSAVFLWSRWRSAAGFPLHVMQALLGAVKG